MNPMAQVLVRNLDEATVAALKTRAFAHGNSLEQELRLILGEAARLTPELARQAASAVRALSDKRVEVDIEALIREDRNR